MHLCVYSPLILTCLKDEKPPPNLGKALGTHRSLASSLKYTATGRFPRRQTPPEEQLHGAFPPLAPHVSDRFEDGSEEFLSHGDNARNRRSLSSCVFYRGVERGDLWHQRLNLLTVCDDASGPRGASLSRALLVERGAGGLPPAETGRRQRKTRRALRPRGALRCRLTRPPDCASPRFLVSSPLTSPFSPNTWHSEAHR